nr:hypothetical protein [Tanacetum cinerariifolium]
FGVPMALISDRGTYFCNFQLERALQKYEVIHKLSKAYHPQTNRQTEVTNGTIKSILERDKDFKVGHKVLLFNSRLRMHPGKLKSKWYGPNVVKTVYPYGAMEITDKNMFSFKVNGQRLKKFYSVHIEGEDDEVIEFEGDKTEKRKTLEEEEAIKRKEEEKKIRRKMVQMDLEGKKWDEDRKKENDNDTQNEENSESDEDDIVAEDLYMHKRVSGNLPWVIMRDMNVTLKLEESSNRGSNITKDMEDFKDCINLVEAENIRSSGFFYTWTMSLRNPDNSILKKLDRVMVSEGFLMEFEGSHAIFQPFMVSDHSLAILNIPYSCPKKPKSFRFANYTADKPEFISEAQVEKDPYNKLIKSKAISVLDEYNEAVKDEEKLLAQKARVDWLNKGDKNSSFFHKVIKGRRSKNRVATICDENGIYYEGDDVPIQFVKHFQQFLGQPSSTIIITMSEDLFCNVLNLEEAIWMVREVNNNEIKDAMFDIRDNRAPGPDGYTSFFKRAWKVVENDVCDAIKEPIACCNVLYKGIRKVITNRIKGALNILRGYGRKNGAKRCAMKIDLQKAYDTVLKEFSDASGLFPNLNISTLFFRSLNHAEKESIKSIMQFKEGCLLTKYLGVPLITKRLSVKGCQVLIDRIRGKTKDWEKTKKMNLKKVWCKWEDIVKDSIEKRNGNNIWNAVRRFSLAAVNADFIIELSPLGLNVGTEWFLTDPLNFSTGLGRNGMVMFRSGKDAN